MTYTGEYEAIAPGQGTSRSTSPVGEIAAVQHDTAPASAAEALALLLGYGVGPTAQWTGGTIAVACGGGAQLGVFDDIVVAFEGRLDNRAELARAADADPGVPAPALLAAAWRRFGHHVLDRIVRDVAAIVVERGARIHAVRDICAGRPLHVAHDDGRHLVASEWQTLADATQSRTPDREWFAAGFIGHSLEATATPYAGVSMVLPGSAARPTAAGWHQSRHAGWHVPRLRDRRPGAYADQFLELFDEAVGCRIAGRRRIGVSLSGGLDSTSVIGTAAPPSRRSNGSPSPCPSSSATATNARSTTARCRQVPERGALGPDGGTSGSALNV